MESRLIVLDDREAASVLAAELASLHLSRAIAKDGHASFMVSGGSSPARMLSLLSQDALDWASVTVGLVDERWVSPDHPGSNEKGVREKLLKGPAAAARFIPMKTDDADPASAVADRAAAYAPHVLPISCILLGIGPDAHTASWYPGSMGLDQAMYPEEGAIIAAVDAGNTPVSGDFHQRMTLTAGPICSAASAILLMFGEDKRSALEQSLKGDEKQFPVRRAIEGLGRRLSIIWAP
ncbi:6-phosphogluconolactonase [Hyphomonas neptunium ATCC 15444]|uniref:6-phosphogluconolactonase n=2 Tax=Hyphomonas TaxID=85 RepID=Q0C1F0_HYPNA|nr:MULTISPECIES: 6-phosphogluconolactonase [Hyphomonas]ABI76688.1 6-phosphogluconolactonase [Hyphomonas neptunium ATCC 15444]KCZ95144.1 6-phosphogluconolactonase [Hyphomonas hirschiana VP5]